MKTPWTDPVFLVHGIRDTAGDGREGDWYALLRETIAPYFRCVEVRYREFHQPITGGIKVFLWPWGPVLMAACAGVAFHLPLLLLAAVIPIAWGVVADERRWTGRWPTVVEWLPVAVVIASLGAVAVAMQGAPAQGGAAILLLLVAASLVAVLERREYAHDGRRPVQVWSLFLPAPAAVAGVAMVLWPWPAFLAVVAVLLVISFWEPHWRRARAADQARRQVERAIPGRPHRPCVIAHSLGTVLTHEVMLQSATRTWRRVIFIGSPLPRRTRWHPFFAPGAVYLEEVYNEAARRDVFIRLAHFLSPLLGSWLGLGGAGYAGFRAHSREPHVQVHDVQALLAACPTCGGAAPAHIHNFALAAGRHSSALLSDAQAHEAWLPFLWGFEPVAYYQFRDECLEGLGFLRAQDQYEAFRSMKAAAGLSGTWRPQRPRRLTLLTHAEELLRPATHYNGRSLWQDRPRLYYRLFELLFLAGRLAQKNPACKKLACPQAALDAVMIQMRKEIRSGALP